ncbi:MAG: hypothetical protein J5I50_10555 [Chitinophagaceae bacterium]|nr:hypothetical protein [Chitinophagaceae bacterium]
MENQDLGSSVFDRTLIRPLQKISAVFENIIDKKGIEGIVSGVGSAVKYAGRQVRLLQSGQVASYFLLMVTGLIIFFLIKLLGG